MPTVAGPFLVAGLLAVLLMGGYLLHAGRSVLIPLALAVLIWQLINAVSARVQGISIAGHVPNRWHRLVVGISLIAIAMWLVVNLIARNVGAVSANASLYEANLMALLPRVADLFGLPAPQSVGEIMGQIRFDVLIRSISAALVGFVGSIGLVALYVAFMLVEQETFDRKIEALFVAPERAAVARTALAQIERRIERYLWIKTLTSMAVAFLSWTVLSLIGCQNSSFWALVIFILNYIPVLGSLIGVVFPALLVLVQFGSFGPFFVAVVLLTVVQIGVGSVLEPRLMGSSLNLSPLAILVALAIWGGLWGFAGMFLCVPMTVILLIMCAQFESTRPLAVLLSADGRVDVGEQRTVYGSYSPAAAWCSKPAPCIAGARTTKEG
jgi:predicted PurR-regulated permease PerM